MAAAWMSGPPSPPPHPAVDSLPIKAGSSMDMFLNKTLSSRDRGESEVFTVAQAMSILTTYIRHHRLYDLSSQMISSDIALENALQLRVLHASQLKEIVASFTLIGGQRPACRLRLALQNRSLHCAAADGKRYFLPTDLAYLLVREGLILVGNSRKSYSMEALRQLVARYVVRKEHAVLDRRNPSVAQLGNDPLGICLGLKVFHGNDLVKILTRLCVEDEDATLVRDDPPETLTG